MRAEIRRLWERRKGEGEKPYAAFCRYLDLGTGRSIHQAVKEHLAEARRPYRSSVYSWWRHWAGKWAWRERAQAYDEYREYVARKAEIEAIAAARAAAAEDRIEQRQLLTEEAKGLRTLARLLATRILEVLRDPAALRQLDLKRRKTVAIERTPSTETRQEEVTPGVLDLVKLAGEGLDVGGRLYRLARLDEPDEEGKPKTAEARTEEVARMLAGHLLTMDLSGLLSLRESLNEANGQEEQGEPEDQE